MAMLRVNPTRMELNKTKKRLRNSQRGHKLLKDKRDDLVKKMVVLVTRSRDIRRIVEKELAAVYEGMSAAVALMSPMAIDVALMTPKQSVSLDMSMENLMGVEIPVYEYKVEGADDIYPYGYYGTSIELDNALIALNNVLPHLLELSQIEKSVQLLSQEIEKTRRTVNALEFVRIPNLQQTVKYIRMKLDENERGNITRLMKVKDSITNTKEP